MFIKIFYTKLKIYLLIFFEFETFIGIAIFAIKKAGFDLKKVTMKYFNYFIKYNYCYLISNFAEDLINWHDFIVNY